MQMLQSVINHFVKAGSNYSRTYNSKLSKWPRAACFKKIAPVMLVLFSAKVTALTDYTLLDQDTLGSDRGKVSYLPGEQYDPFYGVMGHYMTDLVFEGNGPPITISRKLNIQNPRSYIPIRNAVAHFQLDLPRLTYANNSGAGHTGTCINSRLASNRGQQYIFDSNARNTPVTFTHGQRTIKFFSTSAYELPGDISRFSAQDADYVSASNWYIKCSETIGASPLPYNDEFHVYSPDGTIYVMGKGRGIGARLGFTLSLGFPSPEYPTTNVAWRLTKVIDPYGNTLDYIYENNDFYGTSNGQPRLEFGYGDFVFDKLEKIVASDGRQVSLSYGVGLGGANTALTRVESNGSPNKHVVEYEYGDNEFPFGVLSVTHNDTRTIKYEFARFGLSKITYPHGAVVDYNYPLNASNYTLGSSMREVVLWEDSPFDAGTDGYYYPIDRRTITASSGTSAIYNYRYDELANNTFSRLIDTPERTIEYTYRKENLVWPTGLAAYRVSVNDGKLLSMKDYGRIINVGQLRNNPVYEMTYTYKVASTVTTAHGAKRVVNNYELEDIPGSLQQKGTTNIVPAVITTRTSSLRYPGIKQTFIRSFEQYDSAGFGFPTRIKEISASGKIRYIKNTYKNDFTKWIRGKIKGTIVSETVSGPAIDTKAFDYNRFGDINRSSDNGIIITTEFYESGFFKGEIKSVTDAIGNSYNYRSYYRGIAAREEDELGRVTLRSVNSDGTVRSKSRLGDTAFWRYTYDQARRLKSEQSPRSGTAPLSVVWDGLTKKTETRGNTGDWRRETIYDKFGRVVFEGLRAHTKQNGSWSSVRYRYDKLGRKTFESYPLNLPSSSVGNFYQPIPVVGTRFEYDSIGRVSRTVQEAGSADVVTSYDYASAFRDRLRVQTTDGRSSRHYVEYDPFGEPSYEHMTRQVDANGVETSYERDAYGRLRTFNRGGLTRSYNYNANKKLKAKWNPENGSTSYAYYPNGWLKKKTNQSEIVDYTYHPDGADNAITMSGNGESVTRTHNYDAYGNLASLTNQSGGASNTWAYTFDNENNLLSETLSIDGRQYPISYSYNALANIDSIAYPNGRVYGYEPDGFGRAESIKEISGKVVYDLIRYNTNGTMLVLYRGSHRVSASLDAAQRTRRRQLFRNSDSRLFADQQYFYDAASNLNSIDDYINSRDTTMTFDGVNRLKTVDISNADNWSFGYNNHDDIKTVTHGSDTDTYNYNNDSRLLVSIDSSNSGIPTRNFAYDVIGNMTRSDALWPGDGIRSRTLTRNSAGQVARLNDRTATNYQYDGKGLRVKKISNGTIYSIYDLSGKLRYREDLGTGTTSEYLYVAGELIARRDVSDGSDLPDDPDDDDSGSDPTDSGGITVSGRTISWPDDGWYQVQTEGGQTTICEGGRSCTVTSDGNYLVINHTTDTRSIVEVDSTTNTDDGTGTDPVDPDDGTDTDPDDPTGITVSGRTISWPDDGWYQVQTEGGQTTICEGGRSCTVTSDGNYLVINHTTETRTTVIVGSTASSDGGVGTEPINSSGTTVSGRTISWPDDGWYQVQTEDGSTNICEGGRSCVVDTSGTFIVINHTTGTRSNVIVE